MRRSLPRRFDRSIRRQALPPTLRGLLSTGPNPPSSSHVPVLNSIAGPSSLPDTPGVGNDETSHYGDHGTTVHGWLKSVRKHKNVVFAEITDGTSPEGVQAVFKGKARADG
jgi:hypothetical protein